MRRFFWAPKTKFNVYTEWQEIINNFTPQYLFIWRPDVCFEKEEYGKTLIYIFDIILLTRFQDFFLIDIFKNEGLMTLSIWNKE